MRWENLAHEHERTYKMYNMHTHTHSIPMLVYKLRITFIIAIVIGISGRTLINSWCIDAIKISTNRRDHKLLLVLH